MTRNEPVTPGLSQLSHRAQRIVGSLVDSDERVVAVIHPHWWAIVGSASMFIASAVVAVLLTTFNVALLSLVGLFVLGVGLTNMVVRGLRWYFEIIVVTDRRVRFSRGIFLRRTSEIPLQHVNDITTAQGIIGRILHFGRLRIDSGNALGDELITFIPNPLQFRKLLASLEDAEQGPKSGDLTSNDTLSRLERLTLLHVGGFLSDVEFQRAKDALLGSPEPD